ncbi:hypothetical protein H072_9104 [Dactylellina haptotyla CBS 200.50]|uniref:RING-type domain-containing protein n=1 Tax=Dactylellina haptotyla (strain CBS 200.50) TaxID=1284197 RepID=S8BPX2_DACHA|nr:hypothetical protein H072_9104 [Dactylellina haptotyla CBS 200.50]
MPPAQLGDISIDPDEFPAVAQHLQHLHIGSSHPSSSSGSTGYPEDVARHLYVGPNGNHYYTTDVPSSSAPYTGYGYIAAPESGSAPSHAFAGALRSPVESGFHGMGYFDSAWPVYPSYPMNPAPSPLAYSQPPPKRYAITSPGTPISTFTRQFPQNMTPIPQSATSAFPPPTQLSLAPPPSPAVSSSSSAKQRPEAPFPPPNRRFSYDDGTAAHLHNHIRKTYEQYMQDYEGRDARYEIGPDGYPIHDESNRGRRAGPNYYKPSGEYIVPAGTIPRTSTKTPSHGGDAGARRPGMATAVHQSRPPNSRHSSSESGDAEPPYRAGGYDNEYNGSGRPGPTKSRPNSFSYNQADAHRYRISVAPEAFGTDPRGSTGSLGGSTGSRFPTNATAVVHQPDSNRYYHRDNYGDRNSGSAIVHPSSSRPGGRAYNYVPQRSQPVNEPGYSYYQPPEERSEFDERRRRHRSKSRYRAHTPGPESSDRPSTSEDDGNVYRITVAKSRPSSPSPHRRAKSRRRRDSPSPDRYRSKSRMRSKSRARPEIIQARPPRVDSPSGAPTAGSSRPKTPVMGADTSDPEKIHRLREIDRELDRMDRERAELEKMEREREVMMEMHRKQQEEDLLKKAQAGQEGAEKENGYRKHRQKSRHRGHDSRSTSNERSERDTDREERREERRREREREKEKEKEKDKEREREKDKSRGEKERERTRDRKDREREKESSREKQRDREAERLREKLREEAQSKPEPAKVTDPALANPMVENLNPRRERAGIQPGQVFIRPDLLCAMRFLKLCVAEEDPSDDHAHNQLLRLDCGHGYHEDCLRTNVSSRERIPMYQVDLEADKLWCERCRGYFGKKAGR